jgi:16S rRNA (guanine527-N7)-methyltransferase
VPVSRETLAEAVRRFPVPDHEYTAAAAEALLDALAREPDPPTTVSEPAEALDVHVADSLAGLEVEELRSARRVVDIGAGAGFPGLVLAAGLPDVQVDLVESARRKCEVIERLAAAAGLDSRVRALAVRIEDHARGTEASSYDAATVRALAPLAVICEYAAPLLRVGGALIAWKGARDEAEESAGDRAAAQLGLAAGRRVPVSPFQRAKDRNLYVYSKISDTRPKFPRRTGRARKRPLA